MSSPVDDRQQAAQNARRRHTNQYWQDRDRDEYECPDCGDGSEDVRRFEVHHKDRDPFNGSPENLVALCRRCHLQRHGKQPEKTLSEWKSAFAALGSEA